MRWVVVKGVQIYAYYHFFFFCPRIEFSFNVRCDRLIDTAVKTSEVIRVVVVVCRFLIWFQLTFVRVCYLQTGYIQRRLMKAMVRDR